MNRTHRLTTTRFSRALPVAAALLLLNVAVSWAHKEWVHQYIVQEAYRFLENEVGVIQELRDYVGLNYYGNVSGNYANIPWEQPEAISIAVWREDEFDAVWEYGGWFNGFTASSTHFWDADNADENAMTPIPLSASAENAWRKARFYMFGKDESNDFKFIYDGKYLLTLSNGASIRTEGIYRTYECLMKFFSTGDNSLLGYREIPTGKKILFPSPRNGTLVESARKQYGYNLFGRILHLLADMSMPAHVHTDLHNCGAPSWDGDYYELWMGSNHTGDCNAFHSTFNAQNYTATTARRQGGLLLEVLSMTDREALEYLFYTQNQLASHFPSIDDGGNVDASGNHNLPNGSNGLLDARYGELGSPPSWSGLTNIEDHMDEVADESFNFCIRATATMMYWFAVRNGMIECPDIVELQNQQIYALEDPESVVTIDAEDVVEAGQSIRQDIPTGEVIVASGSNAEFVAGDLISLQPGFSAEYGSTFSAHLGPCTTYTTSTCASTATTGEFHPMGKVLTGGSVDVYPSVSLLSNTDSVVVDTSSADTVTVDPWYRVDYIRNTGQPLPNDSLTPTTLITFYTDTVRIYQSNDTIPTNDTLVYTAISDSTGYFKVTLTSESSVADIVFIDTTQVGAKLYPAPSPQTPPVALEVKPNVGRDQVLQVEIRSSTDLTNASLLIHNAKGALVLNIPYPAISAGTRIDEINTGYLSSGTYYITLYFGKSKATGQFSIVR